MRCGTEIPENAFFCPRCGSRTLKGEEEGITPLSYDRLGGQSLSRVVHDARMRYKAKDKKSFNGKVDTQRIYLELDNFNGFIDVSGWEKREYSVELDIEARGYTEEEAAQNLNRLRVSMDCEVVQDNTRLVLRHDIPSDERSLYSIEVHAKVPSDCATDLNARSSNGAISLTDLHGEKMEVHTSNGRIVLEGISTTSLLAGTSNGEIRCKAEAKDSNLTTSNGSVTLSFLKGETLTVGTSNGRITLGEVSARKVTGRTSNGSIEGLVDAGETDFSTSNSHIELTIPGTISGRHMVHTSRGHIELDLKNATDAGCELDLSTSRGRVEVALPALAYSIMSTTHVKARTRDYDAKNVQLSIEAHTSNGSIRIGG